jgi:hypothetical protein
MGIFSQATIIGKRWIKSPRDCSSNPTTGSLGPQQIDLHNSLVHLRLLGRPNRSSFPLPLVTGFFHAHSGAVDLASIASPTNNDLTAAAHTQKHSARRLIETCRGAGPTRCVPAPYACALWQHSALRPLARLPGRTAASAATEFRIQAIDPRCEDGWAAPARRVAPARHSPTSSAGFMRFLTAINKRAPRLSAALRYAFAR